MNEKPCPLIVDTEKYLTKLGVLSVAYLVSPIPLANNIAVFVFIYSLSIKSY